MAEQTRSIPINHDLRPAYYDDFQCLASGCRFTCCKGWKITFGKKDYLSLKRQDGSPELNKNMKKTLRRLKKGPMSEQFYGEFDLAGGTCPLQRADGLCLLQLEKGHEALPYVCRIFPRRETYWSSGYFERSLSPACEGVLELLWKVPEGVDFRSNPLPKQSRMKTPFYEIGSLHLHFQDIRAQCIDFLQDRRLLLSERILLMGLALKKLTDRPEDVEHWIAQAKALGRDPSVVKQVRLSGSESTLSMFLSNNIKILLKISAPHSDFAAVQEDLLTGLNIRFQPGTALGTIPFAPYLAAKKRFDKTFASHSFFMENLMVSLFFHLCLPNCDSGEDLWKSYVSFCNLYSFYRFMAVMSCREGASGDKAELFRLMVCASRGLIHNSGRQVQLRDEFFQNDSATLAHMAVLLGSCWDEHRP